MLHQSTELIFTYFFKYFCMMAVYMNCLSSLFFQLCICSAKPHTACFLTLKMKRSIQDNHYSRCLFTQRFAYIYAFECQQCTRRSIHSPADIPTNKSFHTPMFASQSQSKCHRRLPLWTRIMWFYFTPKVYASGSCVALLEQCIFALIWFHSQLGPGFMY